MSLLQQSSLSSVWRWWLSSPPKKNIFGLDNTSRRQLLVACIVICCYLLSTEIRYINLLVAHDQYVYANVTLLVPTTSFLMNSAMGSSSNSNSDSNTNTTTNSDNDLRLIAALTAQSARSTNTAQLSKQTTDTDDKATRSTLGKKFTSGVTTVEDFIKTKSTVIKTPVTQTKSRSSTSTIGKRRYPLFADSRRLRIGDIYSGMWWQPVTNVEKINTAKMTWLEAATFVSISNYVQLKQQKITMTYDMLDFGVEHLSTYIRYLRFDQKLAQKKKEYAFVVQSLQNYTNRTIYHSPFFYNYTTITESDQLNDEDVNSTIIPAAMRATIAIVPFGLKSASLKWIKDPSYQLRYESLMATIVSMWQLGIGRVVIVGSNSTTEYDVVSSLITNLNNMIDEAQQDNPMVPSMELQFIGEFGNSTLLPTDAIRGLQYALVGKYTDDDDIEKWLGTTNRTKWQYVYFSEPDLILHTRPRTIPHIAKELERGQTIMAHRFQLVPHGSDFPNYTDPQLVMPAVGIFSNVTTVSHLRNNDRCLWDNYKDDRPALKKKTCHLLWNRCGFDMKFKYNNYKTVADVENAFQMYKVFHLMRLSDGTGFTMIAGTEGRNICRIILNNNDDASTSTISASTFDTSLR